MSGDSWRVALRARKYSVLLVVLVALTVGPLVADTSTGHSPVFGVIFLGVLLVGTLAVEARRHWRWIAGILAVAAATLQILWFVPGSPIDVEWRLGLSVAFLGVTTFLILKDVLTARVVTGDTISGAVCAYLLIGILWGLLYAWIRIREPAAFSTGEVAGRATLDEPMIYFSFVTLTTLGYGDIQPIDHAARTLALLEAITGQVYLVVLVARLVSLHAGAPSDPRSS